MHASGDCFIANLAKLFTVFRPTMYHGGPGALSDSASLLDSRRSCRSLPGDQLSGDSQNRADAGTRTPNLPLTILTLHADYGYYQRLRRLQ
ncbi:MAG: hypothetical protein QOJ06_2445 [Pseudonocardiales bacterium]|jgi:hypothetical protein|nr:hypothetical protein [Pseudonocardiales bacterium]